MHDDVRFRGFLVGRFKTSNKYLSHPIRLVFQYYCIAFCQNAEENLDYVELTIIHFEGGRVILARIHKGGFETVVLKPWFT